MAARAQGTREVGEKVGNVMVFTSEESMCFSRMGETGLAERKT